MRSVLSVSMPVATVRRLKQKARECKKTVSAYLVELVEMDMEEAHVMTENELLEYAKDAMEDVEHGRTKKLKKPEDLLLPELP